MSTSPQTARQDSNELLLISEEPGEDRRLEAQLDNVEPGAYGIIQVRSCNEMEQVDWRRRCRAILLDLQVDKDLAETVIRTGADHQRQIALLCLCRDHTQLRAYEEHLHLVDDHLVSGAMGEGELYMRVTHAIRHRLKEYALLQEQLLLHSLMEHVPDAIYFKDRQSRFTKVNKAMSHNYGKSDADLVGKTDFDLFTREHAESALKDEQSIIETGRPVVGKVEKETLRDGQIKWVTTTKLPLRDSSEEIIGTMGISRDITDLKRTQDTLAHERSLMRAIIDNMPDRIFAKDREGRYIATNVKHYTFLKQKDKESVIGKTVFDFFPEETARRLQNEDVHIARSGIGLINSEERVEDEDGTVAWFLTSKVPLVGENGETLGIVGIARDVTKQKKNEEALRNTIDMLNQTRLQLIESEKLKTVGRLAAGVAHEVKNPISVVRMGVEFLQNTLKDDEETTAVLGDMRAATDKTTEVIQELLDYSSPQDIDMEPVELNNLIRRVLALLRHNFNSAKVAVTEDLASQSCHVNLNAQKMEQVFINLSLNAIAAMPEGGELVVRTRHERMHTTGANVSGELTERFKIGDSLVVVEFEDTGHGINPSDKEKLFDPFFSTRSTGEGAGLGLSVTRSIVDLHRGVITLDNCETHRGALARVFLPLHQP